MAGLLNKKYFKIQESALWINAARVLTWQVIIRCVTFFSSAILIRSLGPTNLGVSAVISTWAGAITLLVNYGTDITGVRVLAAQSSYKGSVIKGVLKRRFTRWKILLPLWIFLAVVMSVGHIDQFTAWILGLGVLLANTLSPNWVLQGMHQTEKLAKYTAIAALITGFGVLVWNPSSASVGADLFVTFANAVIIILLGWGWILRREQSGCEIIGDLSAKKTPVDHQDSRWAFFTSVAIFLYSQADMILIGKLASLHEAGVYRAAQALSSPISLLSSAITSTLYPELARTASQSITKLYSSQKRLLIRLAPLCVFGLVVLAVVARPAIQAVLNEKYAAAIPVFRIVVAAKFLTILNGIFGWGLLASRREEQFFKIVILAGITSIIGNVFAIRSYGAQGAATVSVIAEFVVLVLAMNAGRKNLIAMEEKRPSDEK